MSPTGETSDPELTGQKDDEEASGSLGRWIAISLAAITFLGAGIAIVQTDASVNESNTARETTRTAVAALRAGVVNEAGVLLEQDIVAERNSLQRKQAFIARQNGNVAGPLSLAELASIIPQGGELPGARTAAELRRLSFNSEFLSLSQSGLAETRVTWNDRSTQYTTAIAVLAFALFLVGFSLVLRGPRRRIFFGFGLAVALLVVGAAVYIYLLPIPRTSESAIAATARASVESDLGNQERAIDLLDRAIEIDGDYAEPYARRAVARALAANPDFRVTGAVVSSDQQLGKSVEDARRALELDEGQDFLALSFLATIALHAGEYERAISAAAEAIGINSEIPDIRLTKSAAELGLGEFEAAAESLDAARALLSGSDPSERTRGLIAGYLTKLEQVAHRTPARTQRVRRIEREVIANETAFTLDREVTGTAPPVGSVSVDELSYRDGSFRLRARWRDLPPGTELTLVGFERPAPGSAWVQPRDLALFRSLSGSGEQVGEVPIERVCTPVEVRVDAYLDGAFVESATGPGGRATC